MCNSACYMTIIKDVIMYVYCTCFSPKISTWTKSIDVGSFATWPGLISRLVKNTSQNMSPPPKTTCANPERTYTLLRKN